jgi:hypothetical protein
MITNIPTAQKVNNKLQGVFYPLQKEELIALRQAKLINNTAFVHLALRYENPFCDRPIEIIPKQFALTWNIPESSIYKAIAQGSAMRSLCGHADAASSATCNIQLDNDIPFF